MRRRGFRRMYAGIIREGCCVWCGCRLRITPYQDDARGEGLRGDYGDNLFCGLRCGYQYGVARATHEYRGERGR